jgi:hypothetical protein
LLDANVLIDANRDYYPVSRVPEFWEWLVNTGVNGLVKIPIEMYEEIREGKKDTDELTEWAMDNNNSDALILQEECDVELVARIIDEGYAPNLSDDEVEKIGRDPFIIAYALSASDECCVVTTEISKPSKLRANRRLPDVCDQFGVVHCNTYQFLRELNFSTKWRTP